mmetsp:Transcript_22639/g.69127  ORF Transcript_22639/g.69127 Transcript_22639/m.69127 type:complete len:126 (-) Transcript_22639:2270-2647(-)
MPMMLNHAMLCPGKVLLIEKCKGSIKATEVLVVLQKRSAKEEQKPSSPTHGRTSSSRRETQLCMNSVSTRFHAQQVVAFGPFASSLSQPRPHARALAAGTMQSHSDITAITNDANSRHSTLAPLL